MGAAIEVPPGLRDVVVTDTSLGDVRGDEGYYHYRGHPAIELARERTFEEVWALLFDGTLPDTTAGARFADTIDAARALPAPMHELIESLATGDFHPLRDLRTVLSAWAGQRPTWDLDAEQRRHDAMTLCAMTPVILARLYQARSTEIAVPTSASTVEGGTARWWLSSITGSTPSPKHVRAMQRYLIATIDHGFNASTFAARVITSCGADVAAAVVGAIGAFSGPLHGGAPDRALDALDEIGSPDRIDEWITAKIESNQRIMGFGHAVYSTEDPRAVLLRETALGLGGELAELACVVQERVVRRLRERHPDRRLYANVEFYAGVVMNQCGIPREMFTPTFAVARVVGWCANILEQAEQRRLIRPSARYVAASPTV